jgi:hypothetical protein
VIDRTVGEQPAGGQSGVPCPDHDGGDAFDDATPRRDARATRPRRSRWWDW